MRAIKSATCWWFVLHLAKGSVYGQDRRNSHPYPTPTAGQLITVYASYVPIESYT